MKYKKIDKNLPCFEPKQGSEFAAGYDLFYVGQPTTLHPQSRFSFGTNLAIELPPNTYGRIAPRSGLAHKHGIDVLAGVIDADYRGEIKVILVNHGAYPISFQEGDKIAQLIISPFISTIWKEAQELDDTGRGEAGFGSTGR